MRFHLSSPVPAVLGLPLLLASCSVLGEDYADANAEALNAFESGRFKQAARLFAEEQGALESNEFLSLVEQGTAWHVAGQLERASERWLEALEAAQGFEDRPTVSGRSASEGVLSFVINDKTLPYDGESFELVLLHGLLAWDFLRQGSLDDAMVEVFRGYDAQKREEKRLDATYGMNRFARFIAALAQELDGAFDEAEIDLRQLKKELPGHPSVDYALQRIKTLQTPEARRERALGQLVVVYEHGRIPAKQAQEIGYGWGGTFSRISVPAYTRSAGPVRNLRVRVNGEDFGRTAVIEDVYAVARENLDDRVAWTVAKSAGRSVAKTIFIENVADEVGEEHGDLAGVAVNILGGILNTLTERADLRSWLTLPSNLQVLRVPVEAGRHAVRLELPGDGTISFTDVEFRPQRPVLLTARSLGGRLYAHLDGGGEPRRPNIDHQP